jgi:hypothetical protein
MCVHDGDGCRSSLLQLDGGPFRSSSFMKRIPPNYESDILRGERQRRGTTPKALSDMDVGVKETFRSGQDNK